MKNVLLGILLCFIVMESKSQELSEISMPPNGDNEKAEVSQWVGPVKITITYHSPDVHGPAGADRKGHIWGELVHYGFKDQGFGPSKSGPWRAGANESTIITFSNDVTIDSKQVKTGTYAMFFDLEKEGSSYWILSSNIGWGSFQYDSKYDVIRVPTNGEDASYTEWLTYGFDDRQTNSTKAYLQWEYKQFPFKIEVPNVMQLYVDKMRTDLNSWAGFNWQNWNNAAMFCAFNKINLEEALIWADHALNEPFRNASLGHLSFTTLQTKSAILVALGREHEADSVMDKALNFPDADVFSIFLYNRSLLKVGRIEKALEVARYNLKVHPKEKFWTSLGLARSYAAAGDKKNSILNWGITIANIPDDNLKNQRLIMFGDELKKIKAN